MNFKFVRRGIVVTAFAFATLIPVQQIVATEKPIIAGITQVENNSEIDATGLVNAIAEIQKQDKTEKTLKIESTQEIQFQSMVTGKNFVTISEDRAPVMEEADENSDVAGNIYRNSVVKITERGVTWSKIESGNVVGYVKTESLIIGKDAVEHAKAILMETYLDTDILTLGKEKIDAAFSVGETAEEEEARLIAAEEARIAAEEARRAEEKRLSLQKGADIVNYAKQFIGNPYVYGGNSLTRGTDCSGFVKGVYEHFGVSLPRTSYSMCRVGKSVSYNDMQLGDIVCYDGHVGIYAGNGKIVNAINESKGINYSDVYYAKIITIRRIF